MGAYEKEQMQDRADAEREQRAIKQAKRLKKSVTYVAEDGCEVTATPSGHIFYNAADWW